MSKATIKALEHRPTLLAALAKAAQGSDDARAVATILVSAKPSSLKILRATVGWSQTTFAQKVGHAKYQKHVSNWETGDRLDLPLAKEAVDAVVAELRKAS